MDKYLKKIYDLAYHAYLEDEIPVGAIVVKYGKIIGCGYNQKNKTKNPLDHAEIIAVKNACDSIGDWRLNDCDMYVTLEPCGMCKEVLKEVRIRNVYYLLMKTNKCSDDRAGYILIEELDTNYLDLLQKFFKNKRYNDKNML